MLPFVRRHPIPKQRIPNKLEIDSLYNLGLTSKIFVSSYMEFSFSDKMLSGFQVVPLLHEDQHLIPNNVICIHLTLF